MIIISLWKLNHCIYECILLYLTHLWDLIFNATDLNKFYKGYLISISLVVINSTKHSKTYSNGCGSKFKSFNDYNSNNN